jgi:molybdenum cofactor cytidylyltransferase
MFFVLGASAISDRHDIIPTGIERAGGSIVHFGMPVDPGNLLLLGKLDGKFIIGLPGCARSPKVNGLDLVLRRIFAGIDLSREDIMRMGVGGLLMEISERPQPRDKRESTIPASSAPGKKQEIAALVLAAGLSSRMGSNKLLAEVDGSPLIRKTVVAALRSNVSLVVVVTGHQDAMTKDALKGLDVVYAHNAQYAEGISSSLRAGIVALPEECDGAIIMLGDMPEISASLLDRMMAAFAPEENRAICVGTSGGKRGNPVLWARRYFPEMERITGDIGAKHLISKHDDMVFDVDADDTVLLDVDTPEALDALRARSATKIAGAER